jgi:transposase
MKYLDVEKFKVVADKGYFWIEDITECAALGIEAYVPKPPRGSAVTADLISREEFTYDPAKYVYVCPAEEELKLRRCSFVCTNVKLDHCDVKAAIAALCSERQERAHFGKCCMLHKRSLIAISSTWRIKCYRPTYSF